MEIKSRSYRQMIGGRLGPSLSGERLHRLSPGHGVPVGDYPLADVADADAAVAAARAAFDSGPWPRMSGAERSRRLNALCELIFARAEELATADVLESGKPIAQARNELQSAIDIWRYAAGLARSPNGETQNALGADMLAMVLKEPIGVVALITPWNFPFVILSQKLPFALAAGCTAVLKPSELTPGSACLLAELAVEAGIPDGVINVVVGYGATVGQRLAEHLEVDMISFTGSTSVGKAIVRASAGNLKRVALELGGKNPLIVCADADLEAAADALIFGVFFNAGQCCNSSSRVIVDKSIARRFTELLTARTAAVKVGDPLNPSTKVGAIISPDHLLKVEGYVAAAQQVGAVAMCGGSRISGGAAGQFMAPTIMSGVTPDMAIAREEVFGPVLSVLSSGDFAEAIAIANDTHYGLSAGIWTADYEKAISGVREIRAGTVWVNCWMDGFPEVPFGGRRQSGIGRELGAHAMADYMESKSILLRYGPRKAPWATS